MPEIAKESLRIVYDGDCPICSRYVRFLRLQEQFDVSLEDARNNPKLVANYRERGFDLDAGMVVILANHIYHGPDAIRLLSTLSTSHAVVNRLMAKLFCSQTRARILYPCLVIGRKALLLALGRKAL